jgi:hypothetical protein
MTSTIASAARPSATSAAAAGREPPRTAPSVMGSEAMAMTASA